ncbi:MAG: L-threonylcarbamoyladenylate synthase [Patescibacteria group bacterium]|jgi:L-threonylcarbamoyladenylate synthase|nr:L-threonylcarbamoyladenylate synthase [Patescibacteria group bacterium]
MKEFKLNEGKLNNNERDEIVKRILKGEVFATPTDTIYGLSGRADKMFVNKRISNLKEREEKPFILLVSNLDMIKKYCYLNKDQEKYFKDKVLNSSRPVTIILNAKENTNLTTVNKNGTLALRLPKSSFLIKIIEKLNIPLISTSLNISGKKVVNNLDEIKYGYFRNDKPDFLINSGINYSNKSSRLVDLRDVLYTKIIRE